MNYTDLLIRLSVSWKASCAKYRILAVFIILLGLQIHVSSIYIAFCPSGFLLRHHHKLTDNYLYIMIFLFSNSVIIMCLSVGFLGLSYLELLKHVGFVDTFFLKIKLEYFSSVISSVFFWTFLSLLLWDSHSAYIAHLMVFHECLRLCSLFFFLFSYCSSDSIISLVMSSSLLILSSSCSNLLLHTSHNFFSVHFLYFSALEFLLISFFDNFCLC